MIFYFDRLDPDWSGHNFLSCRDTNSSGIGRFGVSPLASLIVRRAYTKEYGEGHPIYSKVKTFSTFRQFRGNYILPVSVGHDPSEWCGQDSKGNGANSLYPDRKNLFAHLSTQQLADIRANKMFLMLDQSHEGYHVPWLWEWFHNSCDLYKINPTQILYVTGDLESKNKYNDWVKANKIVNKILVVPHAHFEIQIYEVSTKVAAPSLRDHYDFKIKKLKDIKLYNALQKRPRSHRYWLIKNIIENGLLEDGINTSNDYDLLQTHINGLIENSASFEKVKKFLPLNSNFNNQEKQVFESGDCGFFLEKLNEDIMLNTWLTVVSEASFSDSDNQCFISEKTFKPIACHHPFIIYGNKHSLDNLKKLGYKTFSPFINEEYDRLSTWDRLDAIIKELTRLKAMSETDRLKWFFKMKPILEHNKKTLADNYIKKTPASILELSRHFWKNDVQRAN